MIILRTPKGWTCPKTLDRLKLEDYWSAHQVRFAQLAEKSGHIQVLEPWMKSYRQDDLFDTNGCMKPPVAELAPTGERRMSRNPHNNGWLFLRDLKLPRFHDYAVEVPAPGKVTGKATRRMGNYLRDVMAINNDTKNFRVMGPDETVSNRLGALLEVTYRAWEAETYDYDDHLTPAGRVMEILSEHTCQGWLEGYLLTGRRSF